MPDTSKQVRISKAIKEINIKLDRAVEFLESKGVEVEKNPNAKISQDAYQLLLDGFQSERAAKAEAKAKKVNRLEKKKTITLDDQEKDDVSDDDEDDSFDPQEILTIKNTGVEPILPTAKAEEAPAQTPAPEPVNEPKAEQPVQEQPKAEEAKPVEQPKEESKPILEVESGDKKVKVLDKIDLDSLNLKTRPDKKSKKPEAKPAPQAKQDEQKPQVAKQSEEQPAPQSKPAAEEVKDTPKASEKSSESKVEATPPAASSEDSGVIETKFQKLEGPTVVGKIDMSQFEKKKKPVASSTEDKRKQAAAGDKNKKKRKRIQKPGAPGDNNNAGGNNQQNRQGGGGNNRFDKNKSRGPKKPEPKKELTEEEIQNQIRETLARLSGGGSKSKSAKYRRAKRDAVSQLKEKELEQQEQEKNKLKVTEFVTVSDLANMMSVSATEVISACMSLGLFVSINQRLDAETLQIVAEEFGYETEFVSAEISSNVDEEVEDESLLLDRAPIVTVMGHVDHGKTSLLDYIRRENVIAGEAGGITQHIGAYVVELENGKKITFLDTPGHEAFTAMRARGAQVTDVAIIVIAADDSVMPQTREAINHAQAAGVPMVFAFNKVDKPGANADKIREELAQMNILVEDWGGKYQCQEISAKKGMGIEDLLDKVLLEAELLELKANPNKNAVGTIIESSLDKGRGYVSSLLVQAGTLKIGDVLLAGQFSGRVKAMFNERGGKVTEAGPSTPVSILGLNGASAAGDKFNVFDDEREAKEISLKRQQLQREQGIRTQKHITLDEIGRRLAVGDFKELNIIVKGDVDGSVEALSDSLLKLSTEKIQVNIIHKSVGQISESDVLLASASDAIIVGFQVRPSASARKLAEQEQIDIRMYSVIYKAIEEVKDAMEGMLAPKVVEKVIGNIEIREVFKITKIGNVAGCYVLDGKVNRNSSIRLIRDGIVIYNGEFGSLKRFKDDVKEVSAGYECGLNIKNFNDIKEGDIIEAYEEVEVQQKL